MLLFHALILALVQALTEFLPVSSSAHLILTPWLLGWPDHGLLFDIALHLGTLAAVMLYFFKTWVRLAFLAIGREVWKPMPGEIDHDLYANPKLLWLLVAATFPAGIAGLFLKDFIETVLRSPAVIGVMLIVVGLLMAAVEKRGGLVRDLNRVSFGDAMAVGCAQALALIPGTSRSGITITAARQIGFDRDAAARVSFLMSLPVIAGAVVMKVGGLIVAGMPEGLWTPLIVGVLTSFVAGLAAVWGTLRLVRTKSFAPFVVYRIVLGVVVLVVAAGGWR